MKFFETLSLYVAATIVIALTGTLFIIPIINLFPGNVYYNYLIACAINYVVINIIIILWAKKEIDENR